MNLPLSGLSIFGDERYRDAARPLFEAGDVGMVEWTVDSWVAGQPPEESAGILKEFGDKGLLIGHGVDYPVLDVGAEDLRQAWLSRLKKDVATQQYCGVSVHFGFSTGWELVQGAPLPVPLCDEALETGTKAMRDLAAAAGCPVGLENLALAFCDADVADQGRFLSKLLHSVDGFLLLDLHNLYCQSQNFGISMLDLAQTYPLERVKELHIAGGTWSEHQKRGKVRRDTHDGHVPDAVFDALPAIISHCPQLKCVMLERLPVAFASETDAKEFRDDYYCLQSVVKHAKAAA